MSFANSGNMCGFHWNKEIVNQFLKEAGLKDKQINNLSYKSKIKIASLINYRDNHHIKTNIDKIIKIWG